MLSNKERRLNLIQSKQQAQFDTKKWQDSQLYGKDTCGTYERCKYCDKGVKFPCVKADLLLRTKEAIK